MKIEILQGPSCSGKSTYAASCKNAVIISRDLIRENCLGKENIQSYFDNGMDFSLEEYITNIEHKMLAKYIIKKKELIIIDNTNLKKKYVQEYVNIFGDLDVKPNEVEIKQFKLDKNECKQRSKNRIGKIISDKVIEKQCEQMNSVNWCIDDFKVLGLKNNSWNMAREKRKWYFCDFEVEPYIWKTAEKQAIICDLDGTLAHRHIWRNDRFPKIRSYYDYSLCETDDIDIPVATVIDALEKLGYTIIFVSGRKESGRKQTEEFLAKTFYDIKNFKHVLLMRKDGDDRNDAIVKYEIFNDHIRDNYYVEFAIDDRDRVCAMWEELGIKVFNCGSLNEHF